MRTPFTTDSFVAAADAQSADTSAPSAASFAASAWISRFQKPLTEPLAHETGDSRPLEGLRFAVKDNIDVEGHATTAGCPAFAYAAAAHATVVRRLLDAGAVLVGKTNLDQFACGLNGTRSPYGVVPSAVSAAHVCGGSSSGSAYVVATGQVDFSLGTDTAGSGRVPATFNNIVGLKPSRGLVSTHGVVPAAPSVDCVSIFTRTVTLAARVFEVVATVDPQDARSRSLPMTPAGAFGGHFRFGVPDGIDVNLDPDGRAAFDVAVARLVALGGVPVLIRYAPFAAVAALLYESALVAERYAAIRGFFDRHEADIAEPVRGIVGAGREFDAADVFEAQNRLAVLAQEAREVWQAAHLDLMVVPTAPMQPTIAAMLADPVALNRRLGDYTNFVNLLDQAAIAVPTGFRPDGLAFGVTLIGMAGSDRAIAALGERLHHASELTQGATGEPLPAPRAPHAAPGGSASSVDSETVEIAVVGAHLSGMPLNGQLLERGARLVREDRTAPDYRLYALEGTVPPKPGLVRVAAGTGAAIAVEVWRMPLALYGSFVALVAAPLGIGTLRLSGDRRVQGFVCEEQAVRDGALDITAHGGWRAWRATQSAAAVR